MHKSLYCCSTSVFKFQTLIEGTSVCSVKPLSCAQVTSLCALLSAPLHSTTCTVFNDNVRNVSLLLLLSSESLTALICRFDRCCCCCCSSAAHQLLLKMDGFISSSSNHRLLCCANQSCPIGSIRIQSGEAKHQFYIGVAPNLLFALHIVRSIFSSCNSISHELRDFFLIFSLSVCSSLIDPICSCLVKQTLTLLCVRPIRPTH